jgi:hypothetical protein
MLSSATAVVLCAASLANGLELPIGRCGTTGAIFTPCFPARARSVRLCVEGDVNSRDNMGKTAKSTSIAIEEPNPVTAEQTKAASVEEMNTLDYARFFGTIGGFMIFFFAVAALFGMRSS